MRERSFQTAGGANSKGFGRQWQWRARYSK